MSFINISYFYIFLFFIFLLIAQEIIRRHTLIGWVTFLVLPVVLLHMWLLTHGEDFNWFIWAKVYSVCLGCCVILLYRFSNIGQQSGIITYVLWAILALNIIEAVGQDIEGMSLPHLLNAAAGVLVMVTIPRPQYLYVDTKSQFRDMKWDMPITWILGYTFWNWLFIYLNWPDAAFRHIAVLGAPLFIAFFYNRERWMQTRAFTLAIFVIIKFTYDPLLHHYMDIPHSYNADATLYFSFVSITWMSIYSFYYFLNYLKGRSCTLHVKH